jgi:hypothetical protein
MAFDPTNRGTLNKNDRKEKDTHADYRGQINIEGAEYWLDAWIKDGPKGKFMSLSVKPKEAKAAAKSSREPRPEPSRIRDDYGDAPF